MSYEVLRYIFIGAAALSGILLIVSILLFILLRIPKVIGDLSGATARKAIENIRSQNESSGDKLYKTSAVNKQRGRLTDKISPSGAVVSRGMDTAAGAMATAKIATQHLIPGSENTTVLFENSASETTLLGAEDNAGKTTALGAEDNAGETTLLSEQTALIGQTADETTVLSREDEQTEILRGSAERSKVFQIEYEITFIHTDEIIA